MSFNARLPSNAASGSHRGRPFGHRPRGGPVPVPKAEDSQPNELLNKRNVTAPPVIRTSALPLPRNVRGRGAPRGFSSARGRVYHPYGPRPLRANTDWKGQRGYRRDDPPQSQGRSGFNREAVPQTNVQNQHTVGDLRSSSTPSWSCSTGAPSHISRTLASHAQPVGADPGLTLQRQAERPTSGTPFGPQNSSSACGLGAKSIAGATGSPQGNTSVSAPYQVGSDHLAPAAQRTKPPLPRRQLLFSSRREPPPHLSGARSRDVPMDRLEACDPPHHAIAGTSSGTGEGNSNWSSVVPGVSSAAPATQANNTSIHASASDLLLSDLPGRAGTVREPTAVTSRSDRPPPSKRRRISPPSTAVLAQPPPSSPGGISIPPSPAPLAEQSTSQFTPRSPAPTLPPDMAGFPPAVKRERSPSPMLDTTAPNLVTEGCVRIAPLPPECKGNMPGYRAARKKWTAQEAKKLRDRGLQPTRIFVREDGMVIDWKSKVPVMSDTLRPPPAVTDTATEVADGRSHVAKKAKQQTSLQGETLRALFGLPTAPGLMLPRTRPIPTIRREEIPAPGETFWKRVHPPRKVPPEPVLAVRTEDVPQGTPANDRNPPEAGASASKGSAGVAVTADVDPEVEIIDLTEDIEDENEDEVHPGERHSLRPPSPSPRPVADQPTQPSVPPPHEPSSRPQLSAPPHIAPTIQGSAGTAGSASVSSGVSSPFDMDAIQAASLQFLRRYLLEFTTDRAALASAYSRAATFSIQALPRPSSGTTPARAPSFSSPLPPRPHRGRIEIVAALLDLPEEQTLCAASVAWDFLFARGAGDVLLACYATAAMPELTSRGNGKGKGKAKAKATAGPLCACEQRFILRPKEWDEEDRSTPGVWPLVVVAHQILFRPLPPPPPPP